MSVQARERDGAVIAHGGDSRIAEAAEAGGELVSRGSVAGFVGGVGFLVANMAFATTQGLPAVAPMNRYLDHLPRRRYADPEP